MITMQELTYTKRDIDIMGWQIQRDILFPAGVVERCDYGYPRIVLMNPVEQRNGSHAINYEALSNIFWLTCPFLNEQIHRLEDRGYIQKIKDLIEGDKELAARMKSANTCFYFLRKAVFDHCGGDKLPLNRLELINSGIAGTRQYSYLKCLHAHFAFFRVCRDDVAGHATLHLLDGKLHCSDGRCKNAD